MRIAGDDSVLEVEMAAVVRVVVFEIPPASPATEVAAFPLIVEFVIVTVPSL